MTRVLAEVSLPAPTRGGTTTTVTVAGRTLLLVLADVHGTPRAVLLDAGPQPRPARQVGDPDDPWCAPPPPPEPSDYVDLEDPPYPRT